MRNLIDLIKAQGPPGGSRLLSESPQYANCARLTSGTASGDDLVLPMDG